MSKTSAPEISCVVPVYREAESLERFWSELVRCLEPAGVSFETVFIDDGSTDQTWAKLEELRRKDSRVIALRLSRNFGKELAIAAGLDSARGQAVVVMDGDLQHPPTLIPEMIRRWRVEGFEVVEAVKSRRPSEAAHVSLGARIFYTLMKRLSGLDLQGSTDFKLMDRRVVQAWMQLQERNLFFRGMSAWLGFKRSQIEFVVPERVGGTTSFSLWSLIRLAVTGITSFTSLPLRLIPVLGAAFFVFSLGLFVRALYLRFTGQAVDGFTTVIILQLLIGSLMMISMGIKGEYLAKIYDEVKRRPRYLVAERLGGDQEEL